MGTAEPSRLPHRLSRQRQQTLSPSAWEGSRRCFHFISLSSRTVSLRQEKPPEKHAPSPREASPEKGRRVRRTPTFCLEFCDWTEALPGTRERSEKPEWFICFVILDQFLQVSRPFSPEETGMSLWSWKEVVTPQERTMPYQGIGGQSNLTSTFRRWITGTAHRAPSRREDAE